MGNGIPQVKMEILWNCLQEFLVAMLNSACGFRVTEVEYRFASGRSAARVPRLLRSVFFVITLSSAEIMGLSETGVPENPAGYHTMVPVRIGILGCCMVSDIIG